MYVQQSFMYVMNKGKQPKQHKRNNTSTNGDRKQMIISVKFFNKLLNGGGQNVSLVKFSGKENAC